MVVGRIVLTECILDVVTDLIPTPMQRGLFRAAAILMPITSHAPGLHCADQGERKERVVESNSFLTLLAK